MTALSIPNYKEWIKRMNDEICACNERAIHEKAQHHQDIIRNGFSGFTGVVAGAVFTLPALHAVPLWALLPTFIAPFIYQRLRKNKDISPINAACRIEKNIIDTDIDGAQELTELHEDGAINFVTITTAAGQAFTLNPFGFIAVHENRAKDSRKVFTKARDIEDACYVAHQIGKQTRKNWQLFLENFTEETTAEHFLPALEEKGLIRLSPAYKKKLQSEMGLYL